MGQPTCKKPYGGYHDPIYDYQGVIYGGLKSC